ncbi:Hypothetical predicted protein [Octopus vulgaris]|uniref:Uncharacterized protein n=1 Tax=Octopus vulgaris TaxID=6645 RepID=A0AA36BYP2_OCTVU|nr:Hypothetical predicted protein [Octopus vulgaris]
MYVLACRQALLFSQQELDCVIYNKSAVSIPCEVEQQEYELNKVRITYKIKIKYHSKTNRKDLKYDFIVFQCKTSLS